MTTPRFSIVTPVYDPDIAVLERTIASVVGQTYRDWEWITVDDASPDARVRDVLRQAARRDPRIVVVDRATNGHIVAASNDGVARARGEFVALLDHDDLLAPHALASMAAAIDAHPRADYLYSDEDKVDAQGRHYDTFRKPPWSPERLRGQMYTGHLQVLRTDLVREVGAFREGFDGSQDHDLALRVTEKAREIVHVPEVLYHWRAVDGSTAADENAKPYTWEAGRRAVAEHCRRTGLAARVALGPQTGTYRVTRTGAVDGVVSVVIPTRGDAGVVFGQERVFVVDAVRSLVDLAGDVDLEIVVVYDPPTPATVLDELREIAGTDLVLVPYTKPFSYSEKCNVGVAASSGTYVVQLNDDVEILSHDFVTQLVLPLADPPTAGSRVGMTGARLLFEDGTLQHAGINNRFGGPYNALQGMPDGAAGPFGALQIDREVTALTGACIALRRETWDAVGGFTETLPVNYNDVDLSLKVARLGLRRVWLAHVRAFHFESKSRVAGVAQWEIDRFRARWGFGAERDLYLPEEPPVPLGRRLADAVRRRIAHRG
ncbi:glycosyltransferase [Xylanimonas allomyrinae]|uniref:Glycosyltransferase n=1 Tax=Xylanimonas allomyrinae TaxID=2509459 RepID=A0A4P6EKY9_9MICO|nr:glycosyltransferase [Xylanimonas allomyrinae]QAY63380.1 glycosyltransferase [Xylanimonas allomyrinae]